MLGAGVVLHLTGDAAEREAAESAARLSDGTLFPSSAGFRRAYDEANAANPRSYLLRGVGSAALVAGAALGAATVVYVVFPRGKAEIRTSQSRAIPMPLSPSTRPV
ncbi:hypothetical protein [Sorangium sp. So ce1151]|uniref:hypothetical protein n=1 Tax=Sorangium sp. So ce1151 TaxID=3133332 RepID=UPI003F5F6E68